MPPKPRCAEEQRLAQNSSREKNWQRWGTYLPERQWGTVREDYSADGNVWASFPYDMAEYRAYRWGEDGILGWTDRQCRLCFSTALWNGKDRTLKERLFGLGNPEGNHGEDVKELFYYLDATPTQTYCKGLYKYPQAAFPYDDLRAEYKRRNYDDLEYELLDTGIFNDSRYFDLFVEYAKADFEDTLIRLTVINRGPEQAELTVLPTLTFRNNWSWRNLEETGRTRPSITQTGLFEVEAVHKVLGTYRLQFLEDSDLKPDRLLFTENDSNMHRLDPNWQGEAHFSKDAFTRYIVNGEQDAVRTDGHGTKCGVLFRSTLEPGQSRSVFLRIVRVPEEGARAIQLMSRSEAETVFTGRISEADEFYALHIPREATSEECNVARQAYAGLLWCKQFYYFIAESWLAVDATGPKPPPERVERSMKWRHLFCRDVLSMPDKWEYPWFAAWDLAFHMIPMAEIVPSLRKVNCSCFCASGTCTQRPDAGL